MSSLASSITSNVNFDHRVISARFLTSVGCSLPTWPRRTWLNSMDRWKGHCGTNIYLCVSVCVRSWDVWDPLSPSRFPRMDAILLSYVHVEAAKEGLAPARTPLKLLAHLPLES